MQIFGQGKGLDDFGRVKAARPKGAQAQFRGLEHHRACDDGRVHFAAVVMAAGIVCVSGVGRVFLAFVLVVANHKDNRRVKGHWGGLVDFFKRFRAF